MDKRKITFTDGTYLITSISSDQVLQRLDRLSTLMDITKDAQDDVSKSIFDKAKVAYDKVEDFTGVIRLTAAEKKHLKSIDESKLTEEQSDVIHFYTMPK